MKESQHEHHQYIYKLNIGLQPLEEHKYMKGITSIRDHFYFNVTIVIRNKKVITFSPT